MRVTAQPFGDATTRVNPWNRYGVYWGGLFGLTLSVVLTAVRLTTNILTIGLVGTLWVAAIECIVITGGFAALAAAILSKSGTSSKQASNAGRGVAESKLQTARTPVAALPNRAVQSASSSLPQALPIGDHNWGAPASLPNIQASLNTIEAWENGSTGP